MQSLWKGSNLGFVLMTSSPILALAFGWEAFLPVALTSVLGGAICLLGKALCTQMAVGQLTADLLQDWPPPTRTGESWCSPSWTKPRQIGCWLNCHERRLSLGVGTGRTLPTCASAPSICRSRREEALISPYAGSCILGGKSFIIPANLALRAFFPLQTGAVFV